MQFSPSSTAFANGQSVFGAHGSVQDNKIDLLAPSRLLGWSIFDAPYESKPMQSPIIGDLEPRFPHGLVADDNVSSTRTDSDSRSTSPPLFSLPYASQAFMTSTSPELSDIAPPPASPFVVDPKLQEKLRMQMLIQRKTMEEERQQQIMRASQIGLGKIENLPSVIQIPRPSFVSTKIQGNLSQSSLPASQQGVYTLPSPVSVTGAHQLSTVARHLEVPHYAHVVPAPNLTVPTSSRPLVTSDLPGQVYTNNNMRSIHHQAPQPLVVPPRVASTNQQSTMTGTIFQVQFKYSVRYFTYGAPRQSASISRGDFVLVEADRGEDIGIVTNVLTMKSFVERRIMSKELVVDEEDSTVGRIVRLATIHERQTLAEKFRSEESILQECRALAFNTYRLPLVIHNVEHQFDRRKLTIYYSADNRVDFREFVRDLFSAYKARIWMKKVDVHKPPQLDPSAAMALATGMQFAC